jgi:O-antigen/teichoic acid export membrane protein
MLNQAVGRGGQTVALLVVGAASGPDVLAPVAFVVTFLALSSALFEDLFVYQLVRCPEAERAFYFPAARRYAMLVALVITAVVYPLTPWLAGVADLPALKNLLRWCLPVVWAHALLVPMLALLRIEMQFRMQFLLSLPSLVGTVVVAFALMKLDRPLGALLAITAGFTCLQALLLYFAIPKRYTGNFPHPTARKQFLHYGGRLCLVNLINTLFAAVYLFVISSSFAKADLGQYFFADRTRELVVLPFIGALQTVFFSMLSRSGLTREDRLGGFHTALSIMSMLIVPLGLLVVVHAEAAFALLLDESWSNAGDYLAIMALAAMLIPLHSLNLTANKVIGRADWLLRLELIKKPIALLVLAVSVRWGVEGIVWGQLFVALLAVGINGWYAGRGVGQTIAKQLSTFFLYLALGVIAFAIAHGITSFFAQSGPSWVRIIIEAVFALTLYLIANILINSDGFRKSREIFAPEQRRGVDL